MEYLKKWFTGFKRVGILSFNAAYIRRAAARLNAPFIASQFKQKIKKLAGYIKAMNFKYFLPYFILAFVFIMTALFIENYFLPMYYNYVKEAHEITLLKAKVKIAEEKTAIFKIIDSFHSGLSKNKEFKIADLIYNIGQKYKINPALVLAVIRVESSFYNFSYSDMGAVGLMQIRPVTALYLINKYKIKSSKINFPAFDGSMPSVLRRHNRLAYLSYLPISYLYDPTLNIKIGVLYLLSLIYRFRSLKLALLAYNVGPTFVASKIYNNNNFYTNESKTVNLKDVDFKYLTSKNNTPFLSGFNYDYYNNVIKYFKTYNKKIFK